ncbi:Hypothetical protein A7982_11167 [Minicystis rosea]|nr:Hypothetical protein A7982_11167 [Minicystis rosea]
MPSSKNISAERPHDDRLHRRAIAAARRLLSVEERAPIFTFSSLA